jgi:hypothetical protein
MPTNDPFTAPGLPPLCYARHPEIGATVLIVRGEDGYHPIRTFLTPGQLNAALAEPPTAAQVRAMLVGSMFGWQVSGADPACQAAATADVQPAAAEPLPLFAIVANWGGPDTPFRLMWRSPVRPGPSAGRLRASAQSPCQRLRARSEPEADNKRHEGHEP